MSDEISPCHRLARELKSAIDALMTGKQVQSVSHRGRSVSYSAANLAQLVSYYERVRANCPDALADPDLIAISPTRGAPIVKFGRGHV